MGAFRLILLPVAAAVAFYFYFFLRRAAAAFGANPKHRGVRIGLAVVAAVLGAVSTNISGLAAIVVLHVLVLSWLTQAVNFIVKKLAGRRYQEGLSRWKKLYGSGILPVAVTLAVVLFGYWNMNHVVQTDYTVYTHKDIRPEGYRVALVSDIHYGISLNGDELAEVCGRISAQDADLVILCGDMVDNSTTKEQLEEVFRVLGTIDSTYGTFYVHGNHDRPMRLVSSGYTEEDLIRAIEENGITILQDEVFPIAEDFVLAGREDRGYEAVSSRSAIDQLLSSADPDAFILTLDHQPNEYQENGAAGTDLLLSGHTHGGQIWPVNLIDTVFHINDAVYGHTQIDEDTQAIVSSGLAGWGWPIKTAAPAEYLIIDIKPQ